jgi:AAA15 family ATPase/GTPase
MYSSLNINNFRCFRDLAFEPLAQMNLIAGKNNVGKTALLEAIWMRHGYQNPELGLRVDIFRGLAAFKNEEIMSPLFNNFDQRKEIVITSTDSKGRKAKLKISRIKSSTITVPFNFEKYKPKGGEKPTANNSELTLSESTDISSSEVRFEFFPYEGKSIKSKAYFHKGDLKFDQATKLEDTQGIYLSSNQLESPNVLAERFGNLEIKKAEHDIIQILKIIEPGLSKLIVRVVGSIPIIYGDIGYDKMIPLPLMGEGIGRLLRIALGISDATNGIVLIDEIENGLHYKVMKKIWKAIAKLSSTYSTQIFATTHSMEAIIAAHEAFSEDEKYDFLLHRLERIKGKISNIVYDRESLGAAIKSKFEIR